MTTTGWSRIMMCYDVLLRKSLVYLAVVGGLTTKSGTAFSPNNRLRHQPRCQLSTEGDEEECRFKQHKQQPTINYPTLLDSTNVTSLSGVSYADVISGIDALYPPNELSNRNAKSRTDGYWKYVARGERPPQELIYGEFDIDFLGILLERSWGHYLEGIKGDDNDINRQQSSMTPWSNKTFCDIGSGAGRLVIAAAALYPEWKLCRGLEILEGLHNMSLLVVDNCLYEKEKRRLYKTNLQLAPIDFTLGSFTNPYEHLGDIDCAFVFSSCMKPELVKELSVAIGRQCKNGTIIITTESPLFLKGNIDRLKDDESMPHGRYEIQLLEKINGPCWVLGGESTAYIHRVVASLSKEYGVGPKQPRQISLEEDAFRLVHLIENGELTDTNAFLRRVRNDMIFHDLPQEFLPDVE